MIVPISKCWAENSVLTAENDYIYKERRKLPLGAGSCSHAIKEKKS